VIANLEWQIYLRSRSRTTINLRGPCAPITRLFSISAVRLEPVMRHSMELPFAVSIRELSRAGGLVGAQLSGCVAGSVLDQGFQLHPPVFLQSARLLRLKASCCAAVP
jgi:hypothetical protein